MGTSKSAAEFSGKLAKMTDGVARLPADTARKNAATANTVMGEAVNRMSGGDGRLSRAGRGRGAGVGVSTSVDGGRVNVDPRGPVHLVENPTSAHTIGEGGARLHLGGRWVTGPVHHRGTRGKGEWARARDGAVRDRVSADTATAMHATTKGAFG